MPPKILTLPVFDVPDFGHDARKLFSLDPSYINLNHGSFGSVPKPVTDGCVELSRNIEQNPDYFMRTRLYAEIDHARNAIEERLGAAKETCVFVSNVAAGINTILRNFHWTPRDVIIYNDLSFESISLALQEIARTPGGPRLSRYRFEPPLGHASMLAQFREHLLSIKQDLRLDADPPPKIIAMIDSITSTPAVACPWKDMVNICREHGAWSIVDAAHSFGQEQHLNLADVDPDFLVANCNKWFYAQRGCAILYVPLRNQNIIEHALLPSLLYQLPDHFPSDFVGKFYWHGSSDPTLPLSAYLAAQFRDAIGGDDKIISYCRGLALSGGRLVAKYLKTSILDSREADGQLISAMVNIELPISPKITSFGQVYGIYQDEMLLKRKIFATLCYYQGKWWARASAQIYNDISDFQKLAEALVDTCRRVGEAVGIPWTDKEGSAV